MKMQTNVATDWWDGSRKFEVPAGEPVETILSLEKVPWADRWDIADGIKGYKSQGRNFVAIKIRDWYAIIDSTWLEHVQETRPARPPGYKFGDDIRARAAANARR